MRTIFHSAMLLVAFAAPAIAHHSFAAEFDAKQPVTLKGTVTRMEWINPHSWIHLDVKNPDGTVSKWIRLKPDSTWLKPGSTAGSGLHVAEAGLHVESAFRRIPLTQRLLLAAQTTQRHERRGLLSLLVGPGREPDVELGSLQLVEPLQRTQHK
jgi:hypothetical protein